MKKRPQKKLELSRETLRYLADASVRATIEWSMRRGV